MAVDKNKAILEYLIQCPEISSNKVFFNYINAKDDTAQIITLANDRAIDQPYIDGSVLKRYTFTIIEFKSITDIAIPKESGYPHENVEDMLSVQNVIDWIDEQNELYNFPDFGDDCLIDSIQALTDNPDLNGIDTNLTPALAKYSISIRVDYLDKSKLIWN